MMFQDVERITTHFVNLLQFPNSDYEIHSYSSNDTVEIQISENHDLKFDCVVTNGTVRVLFNTEYEEESLYTKEFDTPIYLLFILSIVYYKAIQSVSDITFLDVLSVIFQAEITNWKELVSAIADCVWIDNHIENKSVFLNDTEIKYDDWNGVVEFGTQKWRIDTDSFSQLVEMCFSLVEYVAVLEEKECNLFLEPSIMENPMEEPIDEENERPTPPMGEPSMEFDDFEEPNEVVEPNTDFEEPNAPSAPSDLDMDFSVPDGL